MSKTSLDCNNSSFLNKKQLMNLKTKALRSGTWFKTLQRIDKVLFDLTIKVVVNIRSSKLAKSMLMLTKKLENAMEGSFSIRLREIGLPMAQKISSSAQKLGNISAIAWTVDASFIAFLSVMEINVLKCLHVKTFDDSSIKCAKFMATVKSQASHL
jgi:hypothetical protein